MNSIQKAIFKAMDVESKGTVQVTCYHILPHKINANDPRRVKIRNAKWKCAQHFMLI